MMRPVALICLYLFSSSTSKIHAGAYSVNEIYSLNFVRKTERESKKPFIEPGKTVC
jgi:hypothetical protein